MEKQTLITWQDTQDTLQKAFSLNVKRLCNENKRQLEQIGIPKSMVYKIWEGNCSPSMKTISKLSHYYAVTVEELFK